MLNITVEHGLKDQDHPFVMVSRSLIEDKEISNNLKMLIIYCLSKSKTWVFQIADLQKVLNMSRRNIYYLLEEGIKFGYLSKEQQKTEHNKFLPVKYYFYETKIPGFVRTEFKEKVPCAKNDTREFKKCLPCAKSRNAENCTLTNNDTSNNDGLVWSTRVREEVQKPAEQTSTAPPVEEIKYRTRYSGIKSITRSDIFSAFVGSVFATDVLTAAIQEFSLFKHPISDPIAFIRKIAERITSEQPKNKPQKPKEKVEKSMPQKKASTSEKPVKKSRICTKTWKVIYE